MRNISQNWSKNHVKTASCLIENSAIIAAPTDTIYGLICIYGNSDVSKKIFEIKKRDISKNLILFVSNLEQAAKYAKFDPHHLKLAEYFWPGPLTIITESLEEPSKSIAIRITKNSFINQIIEFIDKPILVTSVNISGEKSAIFKEDITESVKKNIDFIFNFSDVTPSGLNSTILKYENKKLKILREGIIKYSNIPYNLLNID